MHNPRGCNNRYNEENDNTQNNNRLFDSQNNNKGGYSWGDPMTFYEGSKLMVEWTAQHACGNDNVGCQIVIQYMCTSENAEDPIRDGTTTETIPNDPQDYKSKDGTGAFEYGMHESYWYYQRCSFRQRNMGLFLADQTLNGMTARTTRQDNNGANNRQGFECPEERDYYPYWAPTPWRDLAVLTTNQGELCPEFEEFSQNKIGKGECVHADLHHKPPLMDANQPAPLNAEDCNKAPWMGLWVESEPWDRDFECVEAPFSRDNHLGNGKDGYNNHINVTMPTSSEESCLDNDDCVCVLRLRYNISTDDTDNWKNTDANGFSDLKDPGDEFIDMKYNGEDSPIKQDPLVQVFPGFEVILALNTDQYGRTFQDRSYVFYLRQRPKAISQDIWNLNVRGRRGNIVEAYPAVEYDYVPTHLHLAQGDYIHLQWTGSNTNQANEAGEGKDQWDRHNLLQTMSANHNYPVTEKQLKDMDEMFGREDREFIGTAGQAVGTPECKTYKALMRIHNNNEDDVEEDVTNCAVLNGANRHFDGGLHQYGFGKLGHSYNFMCSRNNNFTNRSQKGGLVITTAIPAWAIGLIVGGAVVLIGAAAAGGSYYMGKVNPYGFFGKIWGKLLHR